MKTYAKYGLCGALAGGINGLLGAGGGALLVPLLVCALKLEQKKALATSVFIMTPVTLVTAATYFAQGRLDFSSALPYILGGALGGFLAGRLFGRASSRLLNKAFCLLIIVGGVRALLS